MVQRYILPPVWLWPRLNAAVRCWGETRTGPFRNKFACRRWRIKHTRTKVYNQSVGNIIVIPTRQHSWDTACYWVLQSVSDNKTDAEQLGGAAVDSSAVQYCLSGTIFGIIFAARHGLHIWTLLQSPLGQCLQCADSPPPCRHRRNIKSVINYNTTFFTALQSGVGKYGTF